MLLSAHIFILDQHQANGGQDKQEQPSEPSSKGSTYNLRDNLSRQLGQQIPYYKYLNSGAVPKQVATIGASLDTCAEKQDILAERVTGSEDIPVITIASASPVQQPALVPILPSLLEICPSTPSEHDLSSSFGVIKLPEGPPTRSPIPPGWSYSEPSSENSDLSRTFLVEIPDSISPITREETRVITRNPSVGRSQSAPTSPTSRAPQSLPYSAQPSRRRSPFLGISALESFSRQPSGLSLDWDNYASSPTFYRRSHPIPVVITPSTSLDSTPDRDKEVLSASPAPSEVSIPNPSSGASSFPEASSVNRSPITVNTSSPTHPTASESTMATKENMASDSRSLQVAKHEVDTLVRMFPPEHMTSDRLPVYNEELKEIRDKFSRHLQKFISFR